MTEETAGTPRFSFETNCPDGQKCAAITTGCLVGQCQRRSSIPCKHSPQPMLPGQVITGYASLYECPWCKIEALEREVAALTIHLEAEIDSHIASRKSLRERADALEAELDAAKSSVQSITQDYVGMCAVVRGLEAKVTEEMERVDQWKAKYEHQHGLHIAASGTELRDELQKRIDTAAPVAEGDEKAWLIEMPDARWGTGYFWCGPDGFKHSSGSWGVIEKAIRFSRKEDAENVISGINSRITRVGSPMKLEACEHMWLAARTAQATECETNGTKGLRAELDAAKRALAELQAAIDPYHSRLIWNFSGGCYMSDLERKDLDALNAALAAKSTEQPMNCKEAGPGRGLCDMCATGHYEKCRYAAKSTEHTVSICSAHQTPVVGCPRCHVSVMAAKSTEQGGS